MWCNKIMLMVVVALAATPLLAQETSETAPIFIESDSLLIDDKKGLSTYRGEVVFRQGGDSLQADVVRIFAPQRQDVQKIVAEGKPARFERKADLPDESDAWGRADRIEYDVKKELVIFHGNAFFQQGDNQFSGPRIEYSSATQRVKAGNTKTDNGRIHIVIQPSNKEPSNTEAVEQ